MKTESGRSLIEIIGVLAISGVMAAGAVKMFQTVRNNQVRTIATANMKQLAGDIKLLLGMGQDYNGVSVDYLIKAGALKSKAAPIGGPGWSVTAGIDGKSFAINLVELTNGECAYFATAVPDWASEISVNGFKTEPASHCFTSKTNNVSIIVE